MISSLFNFNEPVNIHNSFFLTADYYVILHPNKKTDLGNFIVGYMNKRYDMKTLTFVAFAISCCTKFNPENTIDELKADIGFLSSDSLESFCNDTDSNLFKFGHVSSAEVDRLALNEYTLVVEKDFLSYTNPVNLLDKARIIFATFELKIKKDVPYWNDFKGANEAGKHILAFYGAQEMDNLQNPYIWCNTKHDKALTDPDKKASGLFIAGGASCIKDEFLSLSDAGVLHYNELKTVTGFGLARVNETVNCDKS